MTAEATIHPANSQLKKSISKKLHARKASLTPVEQAFLHALLVDDPVELVDAESEKERLESASRRLDDDVLFSIPTELEESRTKNTSKDYDTNQSPTKKTTKPPSVRRSLLMGLWFAHEDGGVGKSRLAALESKRASARNLVESQEESPAKPTKFLQEQSSTIDAASDDEESAQSDQEVRTEDDASDCSWNEEEGGFDHFDAWQVLKDEYAKESGFDYAPDGREPSFDDDEVDHHTFKILGTSAEDKDAHPHVLSPPLIDSLMNFVPDHLEGLNVWMKYSLVRDGASLDTFKQYVRASKDSILAIETTKGEVFGCYTSSAWRTTFSFFGGAPSFVWRMRYNRNTPCHSLIEQAQLETDIDVYFLLDSYSKAQCLTSNVLGLGEGEVRSFDENGDVAEDNVVSDDEGKKGKNYGFAIALQDDLLSGTTSRCSSYTSPCLVDTSSKGEPFQVLNLELWTFTPCYSLDSAEKLEMTQFFVSESMQNRSINSSTSHSSQSHDFTSNDLSQDRFYRRVGHDDTHEELRERWQYRNMMDGDGTVNRGLGATPRFNNAQV